MVTDACTDSFLNRPVLSLRFWTSRMHAMMLYSLARRASSAAARACSASYTAARMLSVWHMVLEDCNGARGGQVEPQSS